MRDLAIIINARKNSQRCKNKLLRPFAHSTVLDIALSKLNQINEFPCYLACGEPEINSKLKFYQNVDNIWRSEDELNSDLPLSRIYKYHERIDHEWIMFINPCLVLLKKDTILDAAIKFSNSNWKSCTSVIKNSNWFYNQKMQPINNTDPREISTKTSPWIYEVCHAFLIYNRKHLLEKDSYWSHTCNEDPYLYEISKLETIDIDTEEEFIIAENIYKEQVNE